MTEPEHLAAGLSHLELTRFDLCRVNPPLVRTVAALPVTLASPPTDWARYDRNPVHRPDYLVADAFLRLNGPRAFPLLSLARWACIPFSLVGAYFCFRWARELYGPSAGLVALTLWCFCPNVLGNGSLITPDVPSAALAVAACYAFWRWLRHPTWTAAILAGVALGLAELTKFTLLILYPLWPLTWAAYRLMKGPRSLPSRPIRETGMLLAMLGLSVLAIHVGYAFEGSFQRLGDFRFRSRTLAGAREVDPATDQGANRFAGTWLGSLPVPLPKNYLQGMDRQKWEFEQREPSYLRGQWRRGGWWYYYLYALAIKVPLGVWTLLLLAAGLSLLKAGFRTGWADEIVVLLPAVAILALVSSQTDFTNQMRYVLPMFPFAFIWVGKVARSLTLGPRLVPRLAAAALAWAVSSSLWCYPHSLSYFNELAGGPAGGHEHLLDCNIAWGQDLFFLKRWLEKHPEVSGLQLASFGNVDPRQAGIEFTLPPVGPTAPGTHAGWEPSRLGPKPGWYAIDVNFLHASAKPMADSPKHWDDRVSPYCNHSYFERFRPVARAGYSIAVYHIRPGEADQVRRELGLPPLSDTH